MTKTKKISNVKLVAGLSLIESAIIQINQIADVNDNAKAKLAAGFLYSASAFLGEYSFSIQDKQLFEYFKTYPNATMFLSIICSFENAQKNKEIFEKPKV